jgi:hypothetical protein
VIGGCGGVQEERIEHGEGAVRLDPPRTEDLDRGPAAVAVDLEPSQKSAVGGENLRPNVTQLIGLVRGIRELELAGESEQRPLPIGEHRIGMDADGDRGRRGGDLRRCDRNPEEPQEQSDRGHGTSS